MTAETVDADCCVNVAALTKAILAQHRIGFGIGMAVDAILKTVLRSTDSLMHRIVTLMQDVLHVVTPHLVGRFHAFVAFVNLDGRAYGRGIRAGDIGAECYRGCEQPCRHGENPTDNDASFIHLGVF